MRRRDAAKRVKAGRCLIEDARDMLDVDALARRAQPQVENRKRDRAERAEEGPDRQVDDLREHGSRRQPAEKKDQLSAGRDPDVDQQQEAENPPAVALGQIGAAREAPDRSEPRSRRSRSFHAPPDVSTDVRVTLTREPSTNA